MIDIELDIKNTKRNINEMIIHCSASDKGSIEQIRYWHRERGFTDIGYHYVIYNGVLCFDIGYDQSEDGVLYRGRHIDLIGAHTLGHNAKSIGICLIGSPKRMVHIDDLTSVYTSPQLHTLIDTIHTFVSTLNSMGIVPKVTGHNDYTNDKICPGFTVSDFLSYYDLL